MSSTDHLPGIEEERAWRRAGWRASGEHRGVNLIEALHEGAGERHSDKIHFLGEGHEAVRTHASMFEEGDRIATVLRDMGVAPQGTVAIHVPNWPEALAALYASFLLRAVVVPIPSIYGPTEVKFILEDAGVDTYVVADRWRSHDYLAGLPEVSKARSLERVIVVGRDVPAGCTAWKDIEERAASAQPTPLSQYHQPGDSLALVVYTSGSTSNPKGGRHSHDTFLAEFAQRRSHLQHKRRLQAFPGGHVAGLLGTLGALLYGGDTWMLDHWDADLAADLVTEHRLTSVSGAPFYLATLLDAAERKGSDLSSIDDCLVGSAAVPPAMIERAEAAGFHPYRCYGSTEHPTISSGTPDDSLEMRSRTDGAILPGVEVLIIGEDGHPVEDGDAGEIVTRGPDQFLGYTDPEANAAVFLPGGWFRTGDVGYTTPEGHLVITDRIKDVIIRGGENLSSQEIEDILVRHPAVEHVAVVGAPDEVYGERPAAFVVPREGRSLSLEEVREHFRDAGVARQKTPELLVLKDDLPRTAAGKVKKFLLRRELEVSAGSTA